MEAPMKKNQRGAAAIEFAIVAPLLLAICFGITEFGRAIYTYNTLAKSARDAARYLSTQAAGNATALATAKNLVVYGNPAGTGTPLATGLTSANVAICDASNCPTTNLNQGSNPAINTVTVNITGYQFTPVIDLLAFTRFYTGGKASITSITFGDIGVTMRQQS
jgi:Flp pilus assembly protein TadG